jgi:hypothetical protein
MMKNRVRLAFVSALFLSLVLPQREYRAQYTPPGVPGTGKIAGKLLDADGKKLPNSRVLAFHLSSSRLFTSEPTGKGGEFRILELPYGYYDLAIETPEGLFVADRVVNLAPAGTVLVILTVVPFGPADTGRPREHPASDLEPVGLAQMRKKLRGREFWRSPKGVAIITGIGGAALLGLASGKDDEVFATAF